MSIHPDGTGTGWTNVEAVDINQPHGKDYLYSQHIAKGVRKRMNQEHSAFADATVGGIHKPGGCAVLGMEITDDCTAPVVADGTYRGHGLVWSYSKDASNFGVLWCTTGAAGASTTGDWTVLKMHPDLQWSGGDVTWAGAHEFDASVDISGNVAIDGDLTVDGSVDVGGDAAFVSDVSIDGTLAFQDAVLTGDSTFTFDAIAGETGPTFKIFGDWSARAMDVTYAAARTDGFVAAYITVTGVSTADIGANTPYGTVVKRNRCVMDATTAAIIVGLTFPVKKGDTWAVRGSDTTTYGTSSVKWLPLGDNT